MKTNCIKLSDTFLSDFKKWLEQQHAYAPNTVVGYTAGAKGFYSYSRTFSQEKARDYIEYLTAKGFKSRTLCNRIGVLVHIGEFLNVPVKIRRVKIAKTLELENVPTQAEVTRLCDYLKKNGPERYYVLIRILCTTGARISEAQQFTYEQLGAGDVVVAGKGNKYRRFFFTSEIQQLGSLGTGKIMTMTTRAFGSYLKQLAPKVDIDRSKLHAHAFRHYFAKMYLKNSQDIAQLSQFLGHSSLDTTMVYLNKSKEEQKRDFITNVNW